MTNYSISGIDKTKQKIMKNFIIYYLFFLVFPKSVSVFFFLYVFIQFLRQ